MSQLQIFAMEGLRTEAETDPVWDDFYIDEEEQKQKTDKSELAKIQVENDTTYDDDFEDVDDEEEDTKSRETPGINLDLKNSLRNASSTEKLDTESDSQSGTNKPRKKVKGKKLKTSSNNNPPPLNLYQDQLRDHLRYSKDRLSSFNHDTLSDQEVRRRRGRKLHRRGQMKKYHSLEQAVEQAGRDRLEQKYIELEELMSRPLVDNHKAYVREQTQWTSKKQQRRHAKPGLKKDVSAQQRMKAWISNSTLNEDETTDRQAYSTLRKLQSTSSAPQKQSSTIHPPTTTIPDDNNSHQPQDQNSRLTSKPPVPRRRTVSEGSLTSTSSETSHPRNEDDSKPQENRFDAHFNDKHDDDDKFGNVSPRSVYLPAEMHLKYTDNPKLQEWLKRKNVEYRQARKAERVKRKEERLQKQSEVEKREAQREKSCERVKQWMEVKRKEAAQHQKEERRKRKQEAKEQASLRARSAENGVRGSRIDRPQSAPSPNKKHTPIKRPESAARLENGAYMAPKPPDTKFVYKRPVSGKVRLMKLQNEKKAKEDEQKRFEELSPEEKEKRTRMSYDAWLISKRKKDTEKCKEVKRQEDLIRSDPEMDRCVPELAIRRIENIHNERKNIDTGVNLIDDDVNKRFGGGLFGKKDETPPLKPDQEGIPEPSSYGITVEGSAATLVELNSRARPAVAKTHMPIPQSTLSPRRPLSTKPSRDSSPKVRTIMNRDHMAEPNPFKLPFSGDFASSLHVRRLQERVSTKSTSSQPEDSKRPEPQGCASLEPASCPKGTDGHTPGSFPKGTDTSLKPDSFPKGVDSSPKPDTTPRSSLVLLQQIEADAVQSERETKQVVNSENTSTSCGEDLSDTAPYKESQKLFITEPVQSDNPTEDAKHQAGDVEEKNVDTSVELEQEQMQNEDTEKITENQQKSPSSEGSSGGEIQEPDTVSEQQKPDATMSDAKETEQPPPEKQSASSPALSSEENPENLRATRQENIQEGSELEDTPRRSMKRVSFSEELTTVFQSSSSETSSNFDDERGADDEGEDPYMCLDGVPDPE